MLALIDNLWQASRYGVRQIRRSPGFAAVTVVILGVGIGACTAIFSLAEAALFPNFYANQPQRLVGLYTSGPSGTGFSSTSYPDYLYYRDHARAFSGVMAYVHIRLRWTRGDRTTFPQAAVVTGNYFRVLGVRPITGRGFLPDRNSAVAVVSYRFWQRQLASDKNVLGTVLTLNGHDFRIAGVLPRNFRGVDLAWGGIPSIWVPMSMVAVALPDSNRIHLLEARGARPFLLIGRLKQGVALKQAQAEMSVLARQLAAAYPLVDKGRTAFVLSANRSRIWPAWRNSVAQSISLLALMVGFVLLLTCTNVANLLLTRTAARQREIALRLAIGSSRGRLVGQLLIENLILALLGGAAGLVFARILLSLAPSFQLSSHMHMNLEPSLDLRVFLFTLLLSLITALVFGLLPAFRASQVHLSQALKEGGDRLLAVSANRKLRAGIVIVEISFAFLSLIGASLFIRSLLHLENTNPGFDPHNVLALTMDLDPDHFSSTEGARFYTRLLDRLSHAEGVTSACLTGLPPLTTIRSISRIVPEGAEEHLAQTDSVSPGCLKTLHIPILKGRSFTAEDRAQAPLVVIVNQTLAKAIWPHENPIGKRLRLRGETLYRRVIGVAADIKYHTLWETQQPYLYFPLAQQYAPEVSLLVRTKGSPMSYLSEVRQNVNTLNKSVPLFDIEPLEAQVKDSLSQPRTIAILLALFGGISLFLATVGIYAVVSCAVKRRTREIGIRMALGAQRTDVLTLVLRQSAFLLACGIAIGVAAALGVTKLLTGLLYGIKPTDIFSFVAVAFLLAGIALLASYIPARRAAKTDPMDALRYE